MTSNSNPTPCPHCGRPIPEGQGALDDRPDDCDGCWVDGEAPRALPRDEVAQIRREAVAVAAMIADGEDLRETAAGLLADIPRLCDTLEAERERAEGAERERDEARLELVGLSIERNRAVARAEALEAEMAQMASELDDLGVYVEEAVRGLADALRRRIPNRALALTPTPDAREGGER